MLIQHSMQDGCLIVALTGQHRPVHRFGRD
jgi:hypothetical protein